MHVDLHWLDVPERVKYKLATMVYNSPQQGSFVPDRLLHSLSQTLRHGVISVLPVVVNYSSLDTISPHMVRRRAFSVAGPAAWNCLCDELREPLLTANSFRQLLKTRLFAEY